MTEEAKPQLPSDLIYREMDEVMQQINKQIDRQKSPDKVLSDRYAKLFDQYKEATLREAMDAYVARLKKQTEDYARTREELQDASRIILVKPGDRLVISNVGRQLNMAQVEEVSSFFCEAGIKVMVFSDDVDMQVVRADMEEGKVSGDVQARGGSTGRQVSEWGHAVPSVQPGSEGFEGRTHLDGHGDDDQRPADSGAAGVVDGS